MTPEEFQWHIDLVRDRYQYLNLTREQAEEVYNYEQEKHTYSDKHIFSAWEEWDYELTIFKEILNDEQFKNYKTFLNESIHGYEQSLIEQDNEKRDDTGFHEDLINFYETRFLPEFFKDPFLRFGWLSNDKPKIEYLRAEYKRFLDDTKKYILTNHFRHNRTFKPNELKASLVRHKLSCILPDYSYFKRQMEEPTKAIAHFLNTQLRCLPKDIEELLTRKFKELNDFNEANFKKHYKDTRGWHVFGVQLTDEEQKEHRTMTWLLLDEAKYGCR